MVKRISVLVLAFMMMLSVCVSVSADSDKVTLDPDLYTDITTASVWNTMNIQVFRENSSNDLIIKDGDKYYRTNIHRTFSDLFEACDVDGDGEYELIYATNANTSGTIYEYYWCYSKTKEISCAFGVNISYEKRSNAKIVKNADGTYNLSLLGNDDGKLAVENIDGKYWLTVTYPDDAVFDSVMTSLDRIEQIKEIRTTRGLTEGALDDVLMEDAEVEAGTPTPAVKVGRAFQKSGVSMVEIDLGEDNGKKSIKVGGKDMYYSIERQLYVGIVDNYNIDGSSISNVVISDGKPEVVVYGNLDNSKVDESNPAASIGNGDLLALKMYHEGSKVLSDKALIAVDLMGTGTITNQLLHMKLYMEFGNQFPILKQ